MPNLSFSKERTFSTIVFPQARAGAIFQAAISSGKFQGMIWPTTLPSTKNWFQEASAADCLQHKAFSHREMKHSDLLLFRMSTHRDRNWECRVRMVIGECNIYRSYTPALVLGRCQV